LRMDVKIVLILLFWIGEYSENMVALGT
jgi:hypothetical protein